MGLKHKYRVTTEFNSIEEFVVEDMLELLQILRDLMVKEAWPEPAYLKIEFMEYCNGTS